MSLWRPEATQLRHAADIMCQQGRSNDLKKRGSGREMGATEQPRRGAKKG